MISELAVDDSNKELSIFQYGGDALVYSYDGSFLRNDTTVKQAGGMYVFADGKSIERIGHEAFLNKHHGQAHCNRLMVCC